MDHGEFTSQIKQNEQTSASASQKFDSYVREGDSRYRVPYDKIKKAVFSDIDRKELIDIPHAARLQYRLMLLDPVIKARVDYTKARITVIYNPETADNYKEKMSLDDLVGILASQGVKVDRSKTENTDYDYRSEFYNYAYNPKRIREHPPYGYTDEEWKEMKQDWEKKAVEHEVAKLEKFHAFQDNYLLEHQDVADKVVEGYKPPKAEKASLAARLLGRKKKQAEKGFWFHGV